MDPAATSENHKVSRFDLLQIIMKGTVGGAVTTYLSEEGPGGVEAQKFAVDVLLNALNDAVLVQEMHLVLCGVNVHIYVLR